MSATESLRRIAEEKDTSDPRVVWEALEELARIVDEDRSAVATAAVRAVSESFRGL